MKEAIINIWYTITGSRQKMQLGDDSAAGYSAASHCVWKLDSEA